MCMRDLAVGISGTRWWKGRSTDGLFGFTVSKLHLPEEKLGEEFVWTLQIVR